MSITWATLDAELGTFLEDTTSVTYGSNLRMLAFNRAQQYFAIGHTAKLVSTALTLTNGEAAVPSDCVEIAGVELVDASSNKSRLLERVNFFQASNSKNAGYYLVNGKIKVLDQYNGKPYVAATLYYYASYQAVTSGTSAIELPFWAEWAVLNLALSFILYPAMVGQQDLRRFQTRREAGEPEDNPSRAQAEYFHKVYEDLIACFPKQDRSLGYEAN